MKITHVIRGEEWISSAPKHVLLYRYFGWDLPQFIHLPFLRNPDRSKISKRHGHTSAFWYRDQGYLVEAVLNFLATRVWNHPEGKEVFDIKELTKHFRFEDMHIQGPIVDLDKLNWLNGQWIRRLSDREIRTRLKDYTPEKVSDDLLKKLLPHIKERLVTLSEITALTDYFVKAPNLDHKSLIKQSKMTAAETLAYLEKVRQIIASAQPWQAQELETRLRELQALENLKPRAAFMTIRIALTGREATPPLFDVMEMLGKEEVLSRLNKALIRLKTG
jgi:glutamyl-tRNA synthetase